VQCVHCHDFIFFSSSVPQPGSEWASAFLRDQGQSSDSSMARFNGETGVNIPESLIASDAFPTHKFTRASWMRHRHNKGLDKHTKEHILCKADDHRELTNQFICTSMTSLLMHTVAHFTRPSFRPKTNNQPLKKYLSLAVS
jgi:hypothetical protein